MAAFGNEKITLNTNYLLHYDTSLVYNNTGKIIQSLIVENVTTNQTYSLPLNNTGVNLSFIQAGKNIIKFTFLYTDNSSYSNYQKIKVVGQSAILSRPGGLFCESVPVLLQSEIPFQGYNETIATNSFADYHIYYHTVTPTSTDCEQVLRKPIIILDGFDPQDGARSYIEIYKEQLRYDNGTRLLGDELREKGYDVIILNFPKLDSKITLENGDKFEIPSLVKINGTSQTIDLKGRDGGADYIERNAFLLVKLIQDLNGQLATNNSTEKLVIVGPSMGGQIARYALAYMEKQQSLGVQNMNHNTRQFISFDSPNDGANIPLALQQNLHFFGYVGGNQKARLKYEQNFKSPAARQILIEQLDGFNSSSTFHSNFYNSVKQVGLSGSGGYPVNLRKVTLLNGNGQSLKTYTEGIEILHGEGRTTFLNAKVFLAYDNFVPAYNQSLRIAKTRITVPRMLWIDVINTNFNFYNNNSRGSMDAVQGSIYTATKDVYDGFYEGLEDDDIRQEWTTVLPNHTFIPSISVAAFRNSVSDWNANITNRNLLCNNEIYFDGYFMPEQSEDHITLTSKNVEWLAQEIDKGIANCPTICTYKINGSGTLCVNAQDQYFLDAPLPIGYSVVWTVDRSDITILQDGPTSATVLGAFQGGATLTARINNPCGADVVINKYIVVGPSQFGIQYFDGVNAFLPVRIYRPLEPENSINPVCLGYSGYYIDASPFTGGTVTWSEAFPQPGSGFNWNQIGNRAYFYFYYLTTQPRYLKATMQNSCGTTEMIFSFLPQNCNTGGGDPCSLSAKSKTSFFTISPNPADGQIRIGATAARPAPPTCAKTPPAMDKSGSFTFSKVNIYTQAGKLILTQKFSGLQEGVINTSQLIAGNYLVEIYSGSIVEKKNLVIY